MRLSYTILSLLLFAVTVGAGCSEDNPVEPAPDTDDGGVDPFVMNERLGRGVNFGNALEAPNEGDWGVRLEERQFEAAAEAGFATIRLPIRWNAHALPNEPYTIDEDFFERVDWAVEQALENELNLILNVHHYGGMDANPEEHVDRWVALWRQIAERYQDLPQNVLFELLNEPHGDLDANKWNQYVPLALEVIRETNPVRNVVVGPVRWNNPSALPLLELPDDDHLIVTFHFYAPFHFTHQGASWVNNSDPWLGTTWDATPAEMKEIRDVLEDAAAWGEEHNRPLFLGEFGAYSAADMESRARWTDFVAREAERLDMSWTYWEFMAGFGLYIPANDTFREPLLEALIPEAE